MPKAVFNTYLSSLNARSKFNRNFARLRVAYWEDVEGAKFELEGATAHLATAIASGSAKKRDKPAQGRRCGLMSDIKIYDAPRKSADEDISDEDDGVASDASPGF